MAEAGRPSGPPFHLALEQDELSVTRTALNLLVAEEAHEAPIRQLARDVLTALEAAPDERGIVTISLSPPQMKIAHTAVKLLHDDLRYEHAEEREVLRRIIDKLPDEHTMRAIEVG